MSKTLEVTICSRKRLGINKPEISLQRHPSVKSLFPEVDEPSKEYPYINNNNQIKNPSSKIHNYNFRKINIIPCEYKLFNNNETFFIHANPEENDFCCENNGIQMKYEDENNYKNMNGISKPLIYGFNEEQNELDRKITEQMAKGKDFNYIEKSFRGLLKK